MDCFLDNAADEIARLHDHLDSLSNALQAGEILCQVKESLPHGQWLRFVRERTKLSSQSARNYMRLWARRVELKGVTSLSAAYQKLWPKRKLKPRDRLKALKLHWAKANLQERKLFRKWIVKSGQP
jgi:hypothetical protein